MSFSREYSGSIKKEKKTLRGEMARNLKASTYFGQWVISVFTSAAKSTKERREKPYAVEAGVTLEEFTNRSINFRRQVFTYAAMAIISILIAPFCEKWYVLILCSMYFLSWYVIYIRDVHRVRVLLVNWHLRTTPLTLSWSSFFSIIKKSPKYLNPLA